MRYRLFDSVTSPVQRRSGKVPAEYIGRARQLWRDCTASYERFAARLRTARAPLDRHLSISPLLRPDLSRDFAEAWREMSGPFRLGFDVIPDQFGLHAIDLRVAAIRNSFAEWDDGDDEPAVAVVKNVLRITPGRISPRGAVLQAPQKAFRQVPLATVSLHALGRAFERLWRATDQSVIDAMRSLARVHLADAADAAGAFAIPATAGAMWLGEARKTQDGHLILAARTLAAAKL